MAGDTRSANAAHANEALCDDHLAHANSRDTLITHRDSKHKRKFKRKNGAYAEYAEDDSHDEQRPTRTPKRNHCRKRKRESPKNCVTPKYKKAKRKCKKNQTPEEQDRSHLRKGLSEVLIPYVDEDLCSGPNKYFPINDEGALLIFKYCVNFILG